VKNEKICLEENTMKTIKLDESKWVLSGQTENFIAIESKKVIRNLHRQDVLDLCEEMLKLGYDPDFSDLANYRIIFRKTS
jgi:hypothetical protein